MGITNTIHRYILHDVFAVNTYIPHWWPSRRQRWKAKRKATHTNTQKKRARANRNTRRHQKRYDINGTHLRLAHASGTCFLFTLHALFSSHIECERQRRNLLNEIDSDAVKIAGTYLHKLTCPFHEVVESSVEKHISSTFMLFFCFFKYQKKKKKNRKCSYLWLWRRVAVWVYLFPFYQPRSMWFPLKRMFRGFSCSMLWQIITIDPVNNNQNHNKNVHEIFLE